MMKKCLISAALVYAPVTINSNGLVLMALLVQCSFGAAFFAVMPYRFRILNILESVATATSVISLAMAAKVNYGKYDRFVTTSWEQMVETILMLASNCVFLGCFLYLGVPVLFSDATSRVTKAMDNLGFSTASAKERHEAKMTMLYMDDTGRHRRRSITESENPEWESRQVRLRRLEVPQIPGTDAARTRTSIMTMRYGRQQDQTTKQMQNLKTSRLVHQCTTCRSDNISPPSDYRAIG